MNKEIPINQSFIESRIFSIRDVQVMLDSDLAEIYGVSTGRLNEHVKRNMDRFPNDFMFQITEKEWQNLISQNAISKQNSLRSQFAILESARGKHRKYLPYVFTEQGVAGLSGVLKSDTAAKVHVAIMRAFVAMRKFIQENQLVYKRLDRIELRQIESDQKFEQVFKALESKTHIPSQGVFFDGQVFDAYELVSRITRQARQSIVLIDNYIDESVLAQLAKKSAGVKAVLLTRKISKILELDVEKANRQYPTLEVKIFNKSHDRFLIIDQTEVYHLGASLKDLGKRWFAFSKMDKSSVSVLNEIKAWV
jgi:hypothetical protein